jgi:hypothetical protein
MVGRSVLTAQNAISLQGIPKCTQSQWVGRFSTMDRDAAVVEIEKLLSTSLTSRAIAGWWTTKCRYLGGERPIDVLATSRYDRVLEAARAFIEGTYL